MSERMCCICHTVKSILARGMCRRCYNQSRSVKCCGCGKLKLNYSRGYCSNCYHKLGINPTSVVCSECKESRPHYAKKTCKSCYNKRLSYEWRKTHPEEFREKMSEYQRRKRLKSRGAVSAT